MENNKQKNQLISYSSRIGLIIVLLGVIAFINIFAKNFNARLDFTKHKLYTLSNYSKNLVKTLDDVVSIQVITSKKLPPHVISIKQQVLDLLNEYKAYSKGRIKVETVHPGTSKEEQLRLRQLGIPKFQMNVIEKDKMQVIEAYSGIVVFYEDKTEVIPVVLGIDTLEYDLSLAIKKITSVITPEIGVMTSEPTEFETNFSEMKKGLEKQYKVSFLSYEDSIPDTLSTLIIHSPKNVEEKGSYEIDQFLMKGGKGLFMVDSIEIKEGLQTEQIETGLAEQLKHYGVTVAKNLILDRSLSYAGFSGGYMSFTLPYPLWPKLIKRNFAKDHPVLSKLESFVLPWTSSLILSNINMERITATILASTTQKSWEMKSPFNLNPQQRFRSKTYSQYPLAVSLEGIFNSFFKEKTSFSSKKDFKPSSKKTSMVFIGNATFASDRIVNQFPNNGTLFLNLVDWLTLESGIFGIPSRANLDYPIKPLPDEIKPIVKWAATLFTPLLIALYGLFRFWVNKKTKQRMLL